MSFGRYTTWDGDGTLIPHDEIRYIKIKNYTDYSYNTISKRVIIVLKDGTEIEVQESIDEIEESFNHLGY